MITKPKKKQCPHCTKSFHNLEAHLAFCKKVKSKQLTTKKRGANQLFFNAKTQKEEDLIVTKLESAFMIGATDEQACAHTNISRTSLFRYEEKYPEFRNRKHGLKSKNGLMSKAIIHNVLVGKNIDGEPTEEAKKIAWEIYKYETGMNKPAVAIQNNNVQNNKVDLTAEQAKQIRGAARAWSNKVTRRVNIKTGRVVDVIREGY